MKAISFLAKRRLGALGIAGLFALQAVSGLVCGNLEGLWIATFVLVVPAVIFLALSGSTAALCAGAVLVPFILLANAAECTPSQGGGAAMGYVPAFLFGLPLSVLAGLGVALFIFFRERRRAHAR